MMEVRMDRKLTFASVLWVSGFFAGLIAAARWGRMDETQSSTTSPEPVGIDPATASSRPVQGTRRRLADPIVAGARADLRSLRDAGRSVSTRVSSTIGARGTATPSST
jgi:hypothetical protein